jgi:hypothetical protein
MKRQINVKNTSLSNKNNMKIKLPEEIAIKNLYKGQVIKNYKHLCKLTGQSERTGNAKKRQMKMFQRYFCYKKDGQKFLITEIYPEPLPEPRRIPHNAKYVKYIEKILLSYLSEDCPNRTVYITQKDLWLILGIINKKYLPIEKDINLLLSKDPEISRFEIKNFYKRCNQKFYRITADSLNSLANRSIIEYKTVYKIGIMEAKRPTMFHEATDIETRYILKKKREIIQYMGFETESQVYLGKDQSSTFYDLLSQKFKNDRGWDIVFQMIKIVYNGDTVIDPISRDTEKRKLNKIIIGAINLQASDRYYESVRQYEERKHTIGCSSSSHFNYPGNYIEIQHKLSSYLIDLDASEDIIRH